MNRVLVWLAPRGERRSKHAPGVADAPGPRRAGGLGSFPASLAVGGAFTGLVHLAIWLDKLARTTGSSRLAGLAVGSLWRRAPESL